MGCSYPTKRCDPELLADYVAAQDTLRSANAELGEFDPEWAALRLATPPPGQTCRCLYPGWPRTSPAGGVVIVHYYLRETTAGVIGLLPGREP